MLKMKKKCYQTVNYFMKNLFGIDKSTYFVLLCRARLLDQP